MLAKIKYTLSDNYLCYEILAKVAKFTHDHIQQ